MSASSLEALPPGRKVAVYSNGTVQVGQAALLLHVVERHAHALLGGYNRWQGHLNDPKAAGGVEMGPMQRVVHQAVACCLAGDDVAAAT